MSLAVRRDGQVLAVRGDASRAGRPPHTNLGEPGINFFSEGSFSRVLCGSKLMSEALRPEEWDSDDPAIRGPAFPNEPCVKIERARSVRESRDNPALNWDSVFLDFIEKRFAESDRILEPAIGHWVRISVAAVPEANLIEEMKPRPVQENILTPSLVRAEKNCSSEDALEGASNALVIEAGGGKIEVTQEVGEIVKLDHSAFLTKRKSRHPNRYEPILAIRKAEFGMSHDRQGEAAIPPSIHKLAAVRTAKREAAQDEWPGIERQVLLSLRSLLADKVDRLYRFEPALGQAEGRKDGL